MPLISLILLGVVAAMPAPADDQPLAALPRPLSGETVSREPSRFSALDATLSLLGPLRPETRSALAARDVRILAVLPPRRLLVRLPPGGDPDRLTAVPGLGRAVLTGPSFKLSGELRSALRTPGEDATERELRVSLFGSASVELLAQELAASDPRVTVVSTHAREPISINLMSPAGRLDPLVESLILHPDVEFVEFVHPLELHNDDSIWIGQSYDRINGPVEALQADPKPYPLSATIWNRGLTGTGQIIGIADTGLEYGDCFFHDPSRPLVPQSVAPPNPLQLDLLHRKVIAINDANGIGFELDGTFRHGTHVAGSVAGDDLSHPATESAAGHDHGDGMAPHAKIVFEDISSVQNSSCSTSLSIPSIVDLLEQEYLAGARISTNSYGSSGGAYTSSSEEVDRATWDHEDYLVIFSAGNGGTSGVTSFAACKNCIAVGAGRSLGQTVEHDPENVASLSARGPTLDGRIKPDLIAPGVLIESARFATQYHDDADGPDCDAGNPDICFPSFGGCYETFSDQPCTVGALTGTSMAAPTAAGLAALARQYFTDGFHPGGTADPADALIPSAALLKAILLNGARNMTGLDGLGDVPLADAPSFVQGWGRSQLDDALQFPGDSRRTLLVDLPNGQGLAIGESFQLPFELFDASEPLKLTLVWTDPPASPIAGISLVNDLDLSLLDSGGTRFAGNQWSSDDPALPGDRQSAPDPTGRDTLNNVEGILLHSPQPGLYGATISAVDVPGSGGVTTQGFALVITGGVRALDAAPPPVPDGPAESGLTAAKLDAGASSIALSWESVGCPAFGYHLLYGNLADVSGAGLAGSVCGLPTDGSTTWEGVPDGDLFFLIVSENAAGTEGSWGVQSGGAERGAALGSGECGMTSRDDGGACD